MTCRWDSVQILVLSIFLLLAFCPGGKSQVTQSVEAPAPQPADVVDQLYRQIIAHHPLGVPYGAAKNAIWPLLSKSLVRVFETRNACDTDWHRQNPDADKPPQILKPPGFFEDGLFTGPDEAAFITGAVIVRTVPQKDRSFLVYVRVAHPDYGFAPSFIHTVAHWEVGVRVVSEDGRFKVDDILFPTGFGGRGTPERMSKMITSGCRGAHWVGN
jgi:hypothetical protein